MLYHSNYYYWYRCKREELGNHGENEDDGLIWKRGKNGEGKEKKEKGEAVKKIRKKK